MKILAYALGAYNIVGTGFSIIGGINHAIKHFCKTTAEELFKKSFDKVVKQHASDFADLTDPKTVKIDPHTFDNVIASLKDEDKNQFAQLFESEKIAKITTLFRKCIIIPNHQLPNMDLDQRIRPIIEKVIIDFYSQLPFKQEAFNQSILEFIQNNTTDQTDTDSILMEFKNEIEQVEKEVSLRITQDIQAFKDYTEDINNEIKGLKQTTDRNRLDTWESLIGKTEFEDRSRIGNFDADQLLEIAKQANWKISEPYNSYVLALGEERMNLQSALDVCVDFLYTLWDEPISFRQKEFLTLGLLTGFTKGRDADKVLDKLIYLIQNKHTHFLPVENSILRQIRNFQQIYPLEENFMFLEEHDIRLKGTRVGIETILTEYIDNSRPPEKIAYHYYSPTLEQIYATILYYLQNQEKVTTYMKDYLTYCKTAREEYEKNLPPVVVRLRKLIAEKEANSDIPEPTIEKTTQQVQTQSPTNNERGIKMRRFLIDENISPEYGMQLLYHEPLLRVLAIGDEGAPPKSTPDPEILVWCEQNQFNLITNNRESMPQHLADHLAAGHHVPGIFTINLTVPMGRIINELLLIAGASDEEEYMDKITYIPL